MDIEFNGGDEIRQPFRIIVNGEVADLTGCTISAKIIARPSRTLAEGSGLTITSWNPSGDDPHGYFILDEDATGALPQGRIARLRFTVVNASGLTMSTKDTFLKRIG